MVVLVVSSFLLLASRARWGGVGGVEDSRPNQKPARKKNKLEKKKPLLRLRRIIGACKQESGRKKMTGDDFFVSVISISILRVFICVGGGWGVGARRGSGSHDGGC